MYGTVEYLMVMQEGARAPWAAEGSDRVEDLSNCTAQEELDHHLNLAERFGEDWRRIVEEDLRRRNISEDISSR
jgi:hypothetical protein